ncbi:PRTRC system protein C [Candidatus Leptofilum sp.]|uniref:PRTRC system protein C n=1 Tax=Candidatus Leptofilum sp. TaxID=3241576 RepID=UPI003B58B8BA
MTTQVDNHPPRIFKYADKSFPDPGPEYSVEQVLQHLRTFFPELGHARTEEKTLADGTREITFSKQVTRKGALPAPVADPTAIDTLVTALTAVPEYDNPLNPVYEVLIKERPLTLHTLRQHTQLLHDHADQLHDQTAAINKVILSCKRLAPTPLLHLPLGF